MSSQFTDIVFGMLLVPSRPRDKQESTSSIASGELVKHTGGEFGRHGERFTRRSRERNRETEILPGRIGQDNRRRGFCTD